MSATPQTSGASISLSVLINAEQKTVWKFLSDQQRLLAWMTYIPGMPAPSGSTFEPRVGGDLRIIFPNGGQAKGKVVEVDAPNRIVFTWGYDPDVAKTGLGPGACRVEIALTPTVGGTLATLTHSGPMSEKTASEHKGGWRHYLSQLAVQSTMEAHQAHLGDTIAMYFAASMEPDQAKRDALLAKCCAPDIHVRMAFSCCDTLADFSAHIANGLRHMPGVTLSQDGFIKHIHGHARVPWKVGAADGKAMFKGENFLSFSPEGKITQIVGFQA